MEKKGELMLVVMDVKSGKITKVVGVEQTNIKLIDTALDTYGFLVEEEPDYAQVEKELSKPADRCAFMLHTHSSPGCSWVFQDGWWRKVCN